MEREEQAREQEHLVTVWRADPLVFQRYYWPAVRFAPYQCATIQSVVDNTETFLVSAHKMGKDFVAGFLCVWFYVVHDEVRVVTTSVKDDHLRVLWGEIGRFLDTASNPWDRDTQGVLYRSKGGILVPKHRDISKLKPDGTVCKISYLKGMVSERGEGMAGHHATHTFFVIDEASGVDPMVYERGTSWSKRRLIFGNPYPPQGGPNHFFQKAAEQGDLEVGTSVVAV